LKRGHLAIGASVAVAVVVALLIVVLAVSPTATDRITYSPLVGKPAPAIDARTVQGRSFSLGDYRGEWVLVNFFGTWCVPCRQEHPQLRAFDEEHTKAGDGTVVSVIVNDTASSVRSFFAQLGGDWPVVLDPKTLIALSYGLVKVPESYLIDPNGLVEAKISGEVTATGLDKIIAQLKAHQ